MAIGEIIRIEKQGRFVFKISDESGVKPDVGTFVKVPSPDGVSVGLVVDRLQSVREELIPYIPSEYSGRYLPYIDDLNRNYFSVLVLGRSTPGGVRYDESSTVQLKEAVDTMSDEELTNFHGGSGSLMAPYMERVLSREGPGVLRSALRRLASLASEKDALLLTSVERYLGRVEG